MIFAWFLHKGSLPIFIDTTVNFCPSKTRLDVLGHRLYTSVSQIDATLEILMQPKLLIIFAILGITALAIFNLISSHRTQQVIASNQANSSAASAPLAIASNDTSSIGEQPKQVLDKATTDLNQAAQTSSNNLASAEKTTQ